MIFMVKDNEAYRKIHFAVMAIESGARKLGISGLHRNALSIYIIPHRYINKCLNQNMAYN